MSIFEDNDCRYVFEDEVQAIEDKLRRVIIQTAGLNMRKIADKQGSTRRKYEHIDKISDDV